MTVSVGSGTIRCAATATTATDAVRPPEVLGIPIAQINLPNKPGSLETGETGNE